MHSPRAGGHPGRATVRLGAGLARGRDTLFGGVVGPVLLMAGLRVTEASTATLLLKVEGVFTALAAWFVLRANSDRRIALGMALIVAGGVVLAWQPAGAAGSLWGPLAVAGACACWALDNNLTRKVSADDAVLIACVKGVAAGAVNARAMLARARRLSLARRASEAPASQALRPAARSTALR